ncbi:cysteine protease StiP family protein [Undibacterium umbellatum]|uniref:Cysteine protease StiP family protein n=1 Tax=Undibacterium umbellatum TaxID=2762300 RepID=A0ABR6Z814_9BURK|nr:cysteine protease StiP family protein [Undibacterium umbellatum]MBC3907706.1 cysteine protease StiP family protein [Undibacterium umbellatum]
MSFSGSYRPDDVKFLLKQLPLMSFTKVSEKELLIQTGQRHYSEMLSPEALPSPAYLHIFEQACAANNQKMAEDCVALAAIIRERKGPELTIVSLARAGTPVGVILKHVLEASMGARVAHYSISIIRDRGIDTVALQHILQTHKDTSIVFVDGWTGKGVISRELHKTVDDFNRVHGTSIDPGLYVLSDLAGTAAFAASSDDYLIPSSILNATVSGLVSRSILNADITEHDFHGCVFYDEFLPHDRSISFADDIIQLASQVFAKRKTLDAVPVDREKAASVSLACLQTMMARFQVTDINLIKPGIGEATRVLLRRVPRVVLIRNADAIDVQHLIVLAKEKQVPLEVDVHLPYQAVSIIRSALDG